MRGATHCFMTSTLTFVMSTFFEYSGGNFVLLRSLASTPLAIIAQICWDCGVGWLVVR